MSGYDKNESSINSYEIGSSDSVSDRESHVFDDEQVATYYRNLYEEKKYEGRHLFDPQLYWSKAEERKLLRKTELRVAGFAFIMFMALNFDRQNISQAVAGNQLTDLKLSDSDYNIGNTINLVLFLAAELPSQLVSKKLGPDVWIPIQMVSWSVVAIVQCRITDRAGFFVTRGLIGALEGGFLADVILWMSYFYTGKEMPIRLAILYLANPISQIATSLLSYGIFHMQGIHGMEGWRWLYLIEGLMTLIVGIVSFFLMPASPVQTKKRWNRKGWYTTREEKIMVNRILRDDPQKGDMNNRQAISWKGLWIALCDFNLWPIYFMRFLGDIGAAPAKTYMSLVLRRLGFSSFNTTLLLIPASVINCFGLLLTGWIGSVTKGHFWAYLLQPIWQIPPLIAMRFWPGVFEQAWGTYALLTVAVAAPPEWHISSSWCSLNSNSVGTRTVSLALVNMFSQAAGITQANIYQQDDRPQYHKGNSALVGVAFAQLATCVLGRLWYNYLNYRRDKIWNAMSIEQQQEYKKSTKDKGNKRLDFRFHY